MLASAQHCVTMRNEFVLKYVEADNRANKNSLSNFLQQFHQKQTSLFNQKKIASESKRQKEMVFNILI